VWDKAVGNREYKGVDREEGGIVDRVDNTDNTTFYLFLTLKSLDKKHYGHPA
jgi:hypothetical protein